MTADLVPVPSTLLDRLAAHGEILVDATNTHALAFARQGAREPIAIRRLDLMRLRADEPMLRPRFTRDAARSRSEAP